MTDPMGQHWDQPPTSAIELDDEHALMTEATFEKLPDYSGTFPSGVYPGKMWRRYDGLYDPKCTINQRRWLLMWFGNSDLPNMISNHHREILIA